MVARSARAGGARPPQPARGPSRCAHEVPDAPCRWPLPRASQTDENSGAAASDPPAAKKRKKRGDMTGGQWAESHGAAWQTFLEQKLIKCECVHPRTSRSNRRKALKDDEGAGIAAGQPAECLLCFTPLAEPVLLPPSPRPSPSPRGHRGEPRTAQRRGQLEHSPGPRRCHATVQTPMAHRLLWLSGSGLSGSRL